MSTVQRILLTALARSGRPAAGGRTATGATAGRQSIGSEVLTCTPWAGLDFEDPAAF